MNKINHSLTLMVTLAFLIGACGDSKTSVSEIIARGDIELIRSTKKELSTQQRELEKKITRLDSAIGAKTENANLPLVTTIEVTEKEFYHYVELQGDVTTKQNVLIYPEVSGVLVSVNVNEGDRVKKGELLGRIDDGGLSSQLVQMKTQLALLETTFQRQEKLWEQKVGTEIQYLQAKANYESEKSAVAQLSRQLDKFYIKAPFSGVIDDVIKDQGTVVSPGGMGSEVFRIINLSNMFIEVLVPESYITSIVKGKEANIYFPILNETVKSVVEETGNFINPNNRSFNAKILVPNQSESIKPNLTAKVKINDYYNKSAVLIPQSVVSENANGDQYIYVVGNVNGDQIAIANRNIVKTGLSQDGHIEILSGLESGASIIMEGARSVEDGQQVKVLNKQ